MHSRSLVPVLLLALPCLAGASESAVRIECRPVFQLRSYRRG